MEKCTSCGRNVKYVARTTNHGYWCGKCIRALRREEAAALAQMRAQAANDKMIRDKKKADKKGQPNA